MSESSPQILVSQVPDPELTEAHTSPLLPLQQLSQNRASGQLVVSSSNVQWYVELERGRIAYVSHDVEPFTRLFNFLQGVNGGQPILSSDFRSKIKSLFDAPDPLEGGRRDEYEAIAWLVEQGRLTPDQTVQLIERLTQDSLESMLCTSEVSVTFNRQVQRNIVTRTFDLVTLVEGSRQRLRRWRALGKHFWSPYQRLYFIGQTTPQQRQLPEVHHKLRDRLRGITLRQLATSLGQDELDLARSLEPYINEKIVYLRDPQTPYDRLPQLILPDQAVTAQPSTPSLAPASVSPSTSTCTIACVDDSPTITNEIRHYLRDTSSNVVAINDPLKALMQLVRLRPDLILLDVGMPHLDGYELCRLLRRHEFFKKTPIVMVTGNTGFLDRARATMVGSTDYLTKPFSEEGLRKVVEKHLPDNRVT